jgi:hypothetical protein
VGHYSRIGIGVALCLCVALEVLLYAIAGISFFTSLLKGSIIPVIVFVCGCIIGMAWDYFGIIATKWWRYPPAERHPWFYLVLPLFWGVFMIIMQDGYAIMRLLGLDFIPALLISTSMLGLIMEAANLYTRSWVYLGSGRAIPLLLIGWVVGLGFTYVVGFNLYIINPFGL